MMMMGNGNSPSWAEIRLARLREDEKINLYPEEEKEYTNPFIENAMNYYSLREEADLKEFANNIKSSSIDYLKDLALTEAIYQSIISPVLDENFCSNKDHLLSKELIYSFVKENGTDELLRNFKYTNIYLAEVALITEDIIDQIYDLKSEDITHKDQLNNIENNIGNEVNDIIYKKNAKLPKDITKLIANRVQDSIDDFISEKRISQMQLKNIYDKAQKKIDKFNQEKNAMIIGGQQTSMDTADGTDPELGANAMYQSKMDSQQAQELQSSDGDSGLGYSESVLMNYKQQFFAEAREEEYKLLNDSYSIFDGIMRSLLEATHKNKALKERYTNSYNNLQYQEILNDARVMYTILECANTLNMVIVDDQYLKDMLRDLSETNTNNNIMNDVNIANKEISGKPVSPNANKNAFNLNINSNKIDQAINKNTGNNTNNNSSSKNFTAEIDRM